MKKFLNLLTRYGVAQMKDDDMGEAYSIHGKDKTENILIGKHESKLEWIVR